MMRVLFRIFVKIARGTLRVVPVRSVRLGSLVYQVAYRLSTPRGATEIEVSAHGLRLVGPANDKLMMPGLYGGYYEEQEVAVFTRLATNSRVIVDVGANIGLYACLGAKHLPPTGRVIAIEPVPANVAFLRRNVELNEMSGKVDVLAAAGGQALGEVTIHLVPNNAALASASTTRAAKMRSTESVTVPVTTLDSYFDQQPDLLPDIIKVDTEGYDGYVLMGAATTMKRADPTLFVEYLPRWLRECGFDPAELLGMIFGQYGHVFAIDEYCHRIARCTEADLLRYADVGNFHCCNLLATNRPDHVAVIESLGIADRMCQRRVST
jgi:FkbM family methyltransferase